MFKRMLLRNSAIDGDVTPSVSGEPRVDVVVLATRLSAVGYNVRVKTALGSANASTTSCFKALRHEVSI